MLLWESRSPLNEAKASYPLYHSTSVDNFESIIRDGGILRGYKPKYMYDDDERDRVAKGKNVISLTRNKSFNFGTIRMEFDRGQLSNNHKIVAYSEAPDRHEFGESEEVLIADKIDIYKYVRSIEIQKGRFNSRELPDLIWAFERTLPGWIVDRGEISSGSVTTDVASLLVYLVQKKGIKAGPNLKKAMSKLPSDAWKYVNVYPFEQKVPPKPKKSPADMSGDEKKLAELRVKMTKVSDLFQKTDDDKYLDQMAEISTQILALKKKLGR